jgi:hypothetical protein
MRPSDPELEAEARAWVEAVLGEPIGPGTLQEELKSGVALCRLVNILKPGSVGKVAAGCMPFKQMENIAQYLNASSALGVPAFESFQTVDLFEGKNMAAVVTNLHSLGRIAQKMPGYRGPALGVKLANANKRNFTAEQLAQAKAAPTFMGQGSHNGSHNGCLSHMPSDKVAPNIPGSDARSTADDLDPTQDHRSSRSSPLDSAEPSTTGAGSDVATAVEGEPEAAASAVEAEQALAQCSLSEPPFATATEDALPVPDVSASAESAAVPEAGATSTLAADTEAAADIAAECAVPAAATAQPAAPPAAAPQFTEPPVPAPAAGGATYVRYEDREAEDGAVSYGLDRELAAKAKAKYDPQLEAEARAWVEAVLGEALGPGTLQRELKSGEVLCRLINQIKPGSVGKVAASSMPFKQMENIAQYLNASSALGVPAFESFQTVDLFEGKNMAAVVTNLHSLGRRAQKVPGFTGPALGVKLADANKRNFTAEQMAQAKAAPTFMGQGSSQPASRAPDGY